MTAIFAWGRDLDDRSQFYSVSAVSSSNSLLPGPRPSADRSSPNRSQTTVLPAPSTCATRTFRPRSSDRTGISEPPASPYRRFSPCLPHPPPLAFPASSASRGSSPPIQSGRAPLLCFSPFHLPCIQSWAQQCFLKQSHPTTRTCPKCRSLYPKSLVPKSFFCFCGKLQDRPLDDPWKLPCSCSEVCEKLLNPNCGHPCLLLCPPGPCPSCPQSVKAACFCGKTRDVCRCSHQYFPCGKKCGSLPDCGVHSCKGMCHQGACPSCKEVGVYRCHCGRKEEEECCDRNFRYDAACKSCWLVASTCVRRVVMVGHAAGAIAARECMMTCHAMWMSLCVAELAIRC